MREHLSSDKNSHIFKYLKKSNICKDAYSDSCFALFDSTNTHKKLKIKEALHIGQEKFLKSPNQKYPIINILYSEF